MCADKRAVSPPQVRPRWQRRARLVTRPWAIPLTIAMALLPGCAASSAAPRLDLGAGGGAATSQPAAVEADAQQLAGQLVAGVQAELESRVAAAVEARVAATGVAGDVTGYRSEFGAGAVWIVTCALGAVLLLMLVFVVLSHRRAVLRIRQVNNPARVGRWPGA